MSDRAEQAWHELRGDQQVRSLAMLVKHRAPLVTVRCPADQELVAGVWSTSAGPLLVTGSRSSESPVAGTGVFRLDTEGQGFNEGVFGASRLWTPRLTLASESLAEAFPLHCHRCRSNTATTPGVLAGEVVAALSSGAARRM